jgi:hypothetical protein
MLTLNMLFPSGISPADRLSENEVKSGHDGERYRRTDNGTLYFAGNMS